MHGAQYTTRTGESLVVSPENGTALPEWVTGGDLRYRRDIGKASIRSSPDGVDLAQCTLSNCAAPFPSVFSVILHAPAAR